MSGPARRRRAEHIDLTIPTPRRSRRAAPGREWCSTTWTRSRRAAAVDHVLQRVAAVLCDAARALSAAFRSRCPIDFNGLNAFPGTAEVRGQHVSRVPPFVALRVGAGSHISCIRCPVLAPQPVLMVEGPTVRRLAATLTGVATAAPVCGPSWGLQRAPTVAQRRVVIPIDIAEECHEDYISPRT